MERRRELVIVGNGMATCRLLSELVARGADALYAITVVGDEPGGAYNRVQLGKVLAGADPDEVITKPLAWYEEHGVRFVSGRAVERLDTGARSVLLSGGDTLRYDVAVLATGSSPFVPPIAGTRDALGADKRGVFAYRTLDDCLRLRGYARPGDSAVVLGGGLLGLEAAKALSDRGLHVTVVHRAAWLMNSQLDATGGAVLRRQLERAGMFVRTETSLSAVLGDERVTGVMLEDGSELAADLVVLACGVRPRVDVAARSGIPVGRGVLVNDTLATAVPGVYALGDCAEHAGTTYGLVAPAWEQAAVLADLLSGSSPDARYRGSKTYTRLKVAGVEVASFGALDPSLPEDRALQVIEERDLTYRKLVMRGRVLIGAMFVGNVRSAASLVQTFDRGDPLPDDPLELLCSALGGGGAARADRTVCNCMKVSESAIVAAVQGGADGVEAVSACTKAGTGCGSCKSELAELVQAHRKPKLAATA
jgi:nitrite reductase (NADH) large subunit